MKRFTILLSLLFANFLVLTLSAQLEEDHGHDDTPPDTHYAAYYADSDGDGYGDGTHSLMAYNQPEGYVTDNTDCDDSSAEYNPGATEVCGDPDYNCDGQVKEATDKYYADRDGDGYGDPLQPVRSCEQPEGYVTDNADCDDSSADFHPGATEVCGDPDYNCDGQVGAPTDVYYADHDGDGYGDVARSVQAYSQPEGYVTDNTDCDDSSAEYNPGATEVCGDPDYNCDGQVKEDRNDFVIGYSDISTAAVYSKSNAAIQRHQQGWSLKNKQPVILTQVFPNPASDYVVLNALDASLDQNIKAVWINMNGRVVKQSSFTKSLSDSSIQIATRNLVTGRYLLCLFAEDNSLLIKEPIIIIR